MQRLLQEATRDGVAHAAAAHLREDCIVVAVPDRGHDDDLDGWPDFLTEGLNLYYIQGMELDSKEILLDSGTEPFTSSQEKRCIGFPYLPALRGRDDRVKSMRGQLVRLRFPGRAAGSQGRVMRMVQRPTICSNAFSKAAHSCLSTLIPWAVHQQGA